jgi:hypothetical protein
VSLISIIFPLVLLLTGAWLIHDGVSAWGTSTAAIIITKRIRQSGDASKVKLLPVLAKLFVVEPSRPTAALQIALQARPEKARKSTTGAE